MTSQSRTLLSAFLLILMFTPWSQAKNLDEQQNAFIVTLNIQLPDGAAAEDMIVYLEPINPTFPLPINQEKIQISQRNKAFAPYVSLVQKGGQANFLNEDDITHHIYSPVGHSKFSFKIRTNEKKELPNFEQAGEVVMGCNIHDWMSGYILVVDTPYFAKSDAQGKVILSEVMLGDYFLNIWHPQLDSSENKQVQRVEIKDDVEIEVKLKSFLKPLPVQKSEDDFDFLSDY